MSNEAGLTTPKAIDDFIHVLTVTLGGLHLVGASLLNELRDLAVKGLQVPALVEKIAYMAEKKGTTGCEQGITDPETGAFECTRNNRGECECYTFDEFAEEIRKLK